MSQASALYEGIKELQIQDVKKRKEKIRRKKMSMSGGINKIREENQFYLRIKRTQA